MVGERYWQSVSPSVDDGRRRRVLWGGLVVGLALVPLISTSYVTELVLTALVYAMLGVSWNLLAGYAGQISLGHAAFFGIGAYVTAWLTTPTAANLPAWLGLPFLPALLLGALAAGALALAIGPVLFRLHGHYFAVGTLALGVIVQLSMTNARTVSGGATGYFIATPDGPLVGALRLGLENVGLAVSPVYYVGLFTAVGVVLGSARIVDSRLGLGMRAVRDDETAAASLGVDPLRYKLWAFVVSSAMAGLAGAVYGQYTLYLNPSSTLGVVWTIDTLVIVVLGGMGTTVGPLFGTGLFMLLDNLPGNVVGNLSTTVEGLFLVAFVVFLPHGIWGSIRTD